MKREARVLVIVEAAGFYCALVFRGCSRVEKLFASESTDELIAAIRSSRVLGEVKLCFAVGLTIPDRLDGCSVYRVPELTSVPLPCPADAWSLLAGFVRDFCSGVSKLLASQ